MSTPFRVEYKHFHIREFFFSVKIIHRSNENKVLIHTYSSDPTVLGISLRKGYDFQGKYPLISATQDGSQLPVSLMKALCEEKRAEEDKKLVELTKFLLQEILDKECEIRNMSAAWVVVSPGTIFGKF